MRAFTPKEGQHERQASSTFKGSTAQTLEASQHAHATTAHAQQSVNSHAARAEGEANSAAEPSREPSRFAHDFTSLPVYSAASPFLQPKLVVGPPG